MKWKGKIDFESMPLLNGVDLDITIKGKTVDDADIGDEKVLYYDNSSGKIKYKTAVSGQELTQNSDDSQSNTNSTSYQQKLRLTTPSLTAGYTYRIGYFAEFLGTSESHQAKIRVQLDDTTISELWEMPEYGADWHAFSGFYYKTGLSGVSNIDLDYCSSNVAATCYIRRARLEIWRVS